MDENKHYCHFWEDEVIYKILKIKSGSRIIDESYEVRAGDKYLYDNTVIWIPIKDVEIEVKLFILTCTMSTYTDVVVTQSIR